MRQWSGAVCCCCCCCFCSLSKLGGPGRKEFRGEEAKLESQLFTPCPKCMAQMDVSMRLFCSCCGFSLVTTSTISSVHPSMKPRSVRGEHRTNFPHWRHFLSLMLAQRGITFQALKSMGESPSVSDLSTKCSQIVDSVSPLLRDQLMFYSRVQVNTQVICIFMDLQF